MKVRPLNRLLIALHAIFLLTVSCDRGHKDFYTIKYPQVLFTLWLPNESKVQEMYVGKNNEGAIYRRIDSSGIVNAVTDTAQSKKDPGSIDEKSIIGDPEYLVSIIGRNGWNLTFRAILSAKYQDTAVVYDMNKMKQKDFLELYVFGPGRDSSFYTGITTTIVKKDGKDLYKIINADGNNLTYTGMVGKYWFMLQFNVSGKDTALAGKIWQRSHFGD